jgi:hypothetical protein
MEKYPPIREELGRVADHLRLLAALLIKRPDLEASDKSAIAQVMHDLADRLDHANKGDGQRLFSSLTGKQERQ